MADPNQNTPFWRSVLTHLIPPWERRHLRVYAGVRLAVGVFLLGLGVLHFSYGFYGWTALLLAAAALLLSFGYLEMAAARSAPRRT